MFTRLFGRNSVAILLRRKKCFCLFFHRTSTTQLDRSSQRTVRSDQVSL
jgi:hypothetical protein